MARAHPGALGALGRGSDVSRPLSARWAAQAGSLGGLRRRARDVHLSAPSGGRGGGAVLLPAEDVGRRGLSPALAAPCTAAADARGAVLRALPSSAGRGPGDLPGPSGPAAGGGARGARLADWVCAAGRPTPGTVPDLRAAPGVYRSHPPWRCAAACPACGAGGIRGTPPGRPARGVGCLREALAQRTLADCSLPRVAGDQPPASCPGVWADRGGARPEGGGVARCNLSRAFSI